MGFRKELNIDLAIKLYVGDKLPTTIVSKRIGCSVQTLITRLRERNVVIRTNTDYKSKIDLNYIVNDYKNGMSTIDIAKKYNMKPVSIWGRLKKHGIKLRDKKSAVCEKLQKIPISEHQKIYDLYKNNENLNCGDIAKIYGVHKSTIGGILKKYNIALSRAKSRNNNWQGGITKLHDRIRNSDQYRQWRERCMIRDNFTCQITGQQKIRLNVHHIRPFSFIFSEFLQKYSHLDTDKDCEKLFNLSLLYKDFWDLNNGQTISEKYHKKIHKNSVDQQLLLQIRKLKSIGFSIHKISKILQISWNKIHRILKISDKNSSSNSNNIANDLSSRFL